MTVRYLIIEADDFFSSEDNYVDYLLEIEYKSSPSTLIDIPTSDQELGDIAFYDTLGASPPFNAREGQSPPVGKLVF